MVMLEAYYHNIISITLASQDTLYEGSISHVAVEALKYPEASFKVVEIVSRTDAPAKSVKELFSAVK